MAFGTNDDQLLSFPTISLFIHFIFNDFTYALKSSIAKPFCCTEWHIRVLFNGFLLKFHTYANRTLFICFMNSLLGLGSDAITWVACNKSNDLATVIRPTKNKVLLCHPAIALTMTALFNFIFSSTIFLRASERVHTVLRENPEYERPASRPSGRGDALQKLIS